MSTLPTFRGLLHIALVFSVAVATHTYAAQEESSTKTDYPTVAAALNAENYKKAIKVITDLQSDGDKGFDLNQLLVEAYSERLDQVSMFKKLGLAKKMRKAMEYSVELQPDDANAQENLIMFHLNAPGAVGGSKDKADQLIQNIIKSDPIRGRLLMAHAANANEDYTKSLENVNAVLKQEPNNERALSLAAETQMALKEYDKAISALDRCITVNSENYNCSYQLGKAAQLGNTQHDRGEKAFKAFIANGHDDNEYLGYAHYRLGLLLAQVNKTSEAKVHLTSAVKIADIKDARKALKNLD